MASSEHKELSEVSKTDQKKPWKAAMRPKPKDETTDPASPALPGFLKLPLELRQSIYGIHFQQLANTSNCTCRVAKRCAIHKHSHGAILLISRQIHDEAWPYFAGRYTFVFDQPLTMANHFLSILPPQRLLAIKHLTFRKSTFKDPNFLSNLQKVWWHYHDLFSRLDTLTFETVSKESNIISNTPLFTEVLPLLITLLEQGAVRNPKWVTPKLTNGKSMRATVPTDLPPDHKWTLQVGCRLYGPSPFYFINTLVIHDRITIWRNLPKSKPDVPLINTARWDLIYAEMVTRPNGMMAVGNAGMTALNLPHLLQEFAQQNAPRKSIHLSKPTALDSYTKSQCLLGPQTKVIVESINISPRCPCNATFDVVTIQGHWNNYNI